VGAVLEAIAILFEHTPVQRVIAVTDERNAQSIRLLERVGMSLSATTEAIFRGEPCTEHTYALARGAK
jgi:RimJ/RimL family protein N-acetyltransferase